MFKRLNQTVAYTNPYYTVYNEEYRLPNGETATYYGIRGTSTSLVIPLLNPTTLVLVKQFRYLFQEEFWEFPTGRIEANEAAEVGAQRELEEETGYHANMLEYLGWFAPCRGLSDERCRVFVGTELTAGRQHLDSTEVLTVHAIPVQQFDAMITSNEITDGMTLAAWSLYKEKNNI